MGVLCDMFASVCMCVFVLARARAHRTYSFRVRKIPANKRHHYRRNVHGEHTHTQSQQHDTDRIWRWYAGLDGNITARAIRACVCVCSSVKMLSGSPGLG